MLNELVRDHGALQRLLAGPLAGVLDDFVGDMRARGHVEATVRAYLWPLGHLTRWMDRESLTVDVLSESKLQEFLAWHRSEVGGTARRASAALGRLCSTLHTRGLVATESSPRNSVDDVVQRFLTHGADSRGLSVATRRAQGRYVREFLMFRRPAGTVDLETLCARDIINFVVTRAESGKTGSAREAASTLRGFLRFLVQHGLCAESLINAVPAMTHRSARLPRHLNTDQVNQLLTSFDRSHAARCRDYAMTICMVRLGLRVCEVVGLRLEDVAWRAGTVHIEAGKTRRADTLPLPKDVGRAIAEYIRDGRPHTTDRHVFLTHNTPRGRQLEPSSARAAIRRAFDRAGLEVPSKGTHVLRHTLATNMVCQGASLKEVADVLRHRSLDTTAVYARVDLPTLRSVAMPWPEVL